MRKWMIVLACAFGCVLAQDASAAIKYKRFARCPNGPVSVKTCECHAGTSGRYHFCHEGHRCDASRGVCK